MNMRVYSFVHMIVRSLTKLLRDEYNNYGFTNVF